MKNQEKAKNNFSNSPRADRVEVTFYTDPLCCWSYAFLKELDEFKLATNDFVDISYCMGGLIKDWNSFSDPLNNVTKPSQMGPVWLEASIKTNIDMKYDLWVNNPPSSSYPACIAVKTAGLQSEILGQEYFKLISTAAISTGKNISSPEVLVKVAHQLKDKFISSFNLELFLANYGNNDSKNAFLEDLNQVKLNNIGRFPSITMSHNKKKLILTGYHEKETLLKALANINPDLKKRIAQINSTDFVRSK